MTAVLTLICQGETAASRSSRFPQDEPLEVRELSHVRQLQDSLAKYLSVWCAPQLVAQQTAEALSLSADIDATLVDINYGVWAGLPLKMVMAQDAPAFQAWLQGSPPPGGETLTQLQERCRYWLEQRVATHGGYCAVVSAAVIRAMVLCVLSAPEKAFPQIDIHPLSMTELCSDGHRWHVRKLGWR